MIEIPPNTLMARLVELENWASEVPDEWKTVPALTEEQARVYRTKVTLLRFEGPYKFLSLRVEGTIPVYSGEDCIGCLGQVDVSGEEVIANIIIDYATPERLSFENDQIVAEPVIGPDEFEGSVLYGSDLLKRVNLKQK